jgi:iron complex outermembrane recepter protein
MKPNTPAQTPARRVLALLLALAPGLLAAQTTPAAAPADPSKPKEDSTIMLSEFRVDTTQDRGYLATNSTAGTRLNTPIKQLPMQLEVITRDFIDDIGAVDFKEALLYSAGVIQDNVQGANNFLFSPSGTGQSGSLNPDGTAISIRGYNTRFLLRNGFRLDTVADTINVGRQELVRGPQALLYGVSALAGIVNVDPRYPRGTPASMVRLSFGSYDFLRGEAHTTGPLLRTDNVRVNYAAGLVYSTQRRAEEFGDRRRILVTPSVDIQFGPNTKLFFDLEAGKFKDIGTGAQDFGEPNIGNIRNENGLLQASNLNSTRDGVSVARDLFGRSRFFRWTGEAQESERDYFSGTVQLTQKVGDRLEILAGANYNWTDSLSRNIGAGVSQSLAATMPTTPGIWNDAGPNPLNPTQRVWRTMNYSFSFPEQEKIITQARLDFLYNFELFGNRQDILIGRQDVQIRQDNLGNTQIRSNTGVANSGSFRAYNDLSYFGYGGEQVRPTTDSTFWEWNTGHYVVVQSKWWKERINAIGGYRWDRYHVRALDWDYVKLDPALGNEVITNWERPATPRNGGNSAAGAVPIVNGYRFGGKVQRDGNATYGANVKVTDAINVFALSGSGILPNTGQRDGAGNPFGAEKTKGLDAGIKADLFKNSDGRPKISLQAGAYRVERENGVYNVFWAPQPRSNNRVRDIGQGVPVGGRMAMGTGPNAYAVYSSGFGDFETSRPVTYLLPATYVAAADLNHPRVTGAPQLDGFILVDYASLGTPAADPIRRAMNAAATDPTNLGALQGGAVGSGATSLQANNGYARNRNSDVAYDDKSEGIDLSIVLNPFKNYSATLGYSYIKQEVTGGFRVVDQPRGTEYDSWWNYMGIPLADRQALGGDKTGSIDFGGTAVGNRTIDAPIRQFTMWNRYEFTNDRLKGLDVSLGLIHQAERQSEIALDNGVRTRADGRENQRFRPPYPSDTKVNVAFGYRMKIAQRQVRFQVNINNVLDDQKDESYGSSKIWILPATGQAVGSTTVGATQITVPERARIYFTPITFRFSTSVQF